MFTTIQKIIKLRKVSSTKLITRTFLSQAYYCQEVWDNRLNTPLFHKINVDELYQELDQRFNKTGQISAVDVDLFTNALKNNEYVDEMLDLVHKLRLSADTGNTLNSTSHAVIRLLTKYGNKKDMLSVLDDRINYGIFLDYYTANILMDMFWKEKDFTSGARVASQLMLQEELDHPLSTQLSLLHCYNYLMQPGEWPFPSPPEEPEEEIKIRVKYVRNAFDDDHFDLKNPQKIVGKTLALFTNNKQDSFNKSFNVLGWTLYNKKDKAEVILKECETENISLYKEILDLIPENSEIKTTFLDSNLESINVQQILEENVVKAVQKTFESDIAEQCKIFAIWDQERIDALEKQRRRLLIAQRVAHMEKLKEKLEQKETKLWFFDNEEQIELQIEEGEKVGQSTVKDTKNTKQDPDENYIPPEIWSKQRN